MKKTELPQKTCVTCGRPFSWRKKWAAVWDEVRYCSERCRRSRNSTSVSHHLQNTTKTKETPV